MSGSVQTTRFRFWLWLIGLIGVIVPRRLRGDWRLEWEAELVHREAMLAEWDRLNWRSKGSLLWRSTSAFWDALWMQSHRWEDEMFQDLRYGVRMLLKNPGFTFIAVLTLALGIGANSAIFSVINGVLLRPLPYDQPDRLVMLWTDNPTWDLGLHELPAANSDLREWRAASKSFKQIAAFQTDFADVSDDGNPQRVGGVDISANLLPMLGVNAVFGRTFTEDEETLGQDRVVLISHALWQQRFGGAADALGKTIVVNEVPREIIGVLPDGFHFPRASEMPHIYHLPEKTDLWMPLAKNDKFWENHEQRQLLLMARLNPGLTQNQAQAEMDGIAAHQGIEHPQTHEGWRIWITPLFSQIIGQTRTPLLVLLGAVGFLLLIACANIASLLLARGAARRREMAVRTAIGAGRSRIIRQLLTESILLSVLGGSLGILFGYGGLAVLLRFIPQTVPRLQNITLDGNVFLFTALITILTGVLFGLVPAWQASKLSLAEALNVSGRMNSTAGGNRTNGLLVTVEFSLAVVLLIGAALMLQSFRHLLAVDPGFKAESVATFDLSPSWSRWAGVKRAQFYEQACERLSNLHGVLDVGAISTLPLSGNENITWMAIEGMPPVPRGKEPVAEDRLITPGYFKAMGVNLIAGRAFDRTDSADKPPVVIVNETLAKQFFPSADVVGKRIRRVLDDKDWGTIVGVVRDVRSFGLQTQARPQFYHPFAQEPDENEMSVVLRVDDAALPSLRSAVQQEIKQLDSTLPVANFRTMEQLVATAVARPRFTALLLGLFAAMALLLTVVGIYGVVAHGVTQRTREIGIRMALGAQQANVLSLVIRQGMKPALIGLTIGIAGAFVLMRLLASQFYEVRATDPTTFAVVGCSLLLMALIACYIPARRAVKIDPMVALRHE